MPRKKSGFITFATMSKLLLLSVFILLGGFSTAFGQSEIIRNSAGFRWHGGFLFAHHQDMRHLATNHFNAWELNYQRKFSGDKDWHHDYRLPSWGITALAMPVINQPIGAAFALFPYYYLPLTNGGRLNLNLKIGAGFGYLTESFNRIENHKNIAISTKSNIALQLGLDLRVQLFPRIEWNNGIFITHFSNGAVRMPNLGLNFLTVSSGITYRFGPVEEQRYERKYFVRNPTISWSLFAGAGLKQSRVLQGNISPAFTLQIFGEKRLSRKFSLGAGAEFNYNSALPLAYQAKELVADNAAELRGGLLIGSVFHFNDMEIIAQMGGYVLDPGLIDGRFFNRFGLRHKVSNRLKVNLTLRTHYAKADHFELGLVYRLSIL